MKTSQSLPSLNALRAFEAAARLRSVSQAAAELHVTHGAVSRQLRALEEEGTRKRSKEVLLKAPVGIVNYLFNQKREHIALIEARYGMSVRIEADPSLISPDYAIEKFKTATRLVAEHAPVISGHAGLMGDPVDEIEDDIVEEDVAEDLVELGAFVSHDASDAAGAVSLGGPWTQPGEG